LKVMRGRLDAIRSGSKPGSRNPRNPCRNGYKRLAEA
jgi:hypothetical protein